MLTFAPSKIYLSYHVAYLPLLAAPAYVYVS